MPRNQAGRRGRGAPQVGSGGSHDISGWRDLHKQIVEKTNGVKPGMAVFGVEKGEGLEDGRSHILNPSCGNYFRGIN